MPVYDYQCPDCGAVWTVVTTVRCSTQCEFCGADGVRQWTIRNLDVRMHDSKNMTPGEIELALDHRRDLERGVAAGEYDITIKGPAEFRPEIPKRLY